MINFVVCEDNKIILQRNIDIINRVMFKNNINYRVYSFSNYCDDLKKLIKSDIGKKIYILDIELEDVSGIDIAINIREKDLNSFVIIITNSKYLICYRKHYNNLYNYCKYETITKNIVFNYYSYSHIYY